MGSIDTGISEVKKSKNSLPKIIVQSIIHGILGFTGFFAVLSVTKYIGYLIGSLSSFHIELGDLFLCSIGFIFSFLIKILSSFQDEEAR